jgi:hypothetical protein
MFTWMERTRDMDDVTHGTSDPHGALDQHPAQVRRAESLAAQIQREAGIIAKAHADIEAGQGIEDSDMEVWLDGLDQDSL